MFSPGTYCCWHDNGVLGVITCKGEKRKLTVQHQVAQSGRCSVLVKRDHSLLATYKSQYCFPDQLLKDACVHVHKVWKFIALSELFQMVCLAQHFHYVDYMLQIRATTSCPNVQHVSL